MNNERTVGLDVGEVRIGIAVSDPLGIIAQPRQVLRRTTLAEDLQAIKSLVEELAAIRIVVGLPLDQHGKPGLQAEKVEQFVAALRSAVAVDVVTMDERFSTAAAQRFLIDADVSRRRRKKVIDKVAAQHILQSYLDRMAARRKASRSDG
ncbi:MAG: Holliday junction resolvase RuvX [Candidatus Hydrogenedentes bacterium]|nr:Holliday junction resolvase RuvX [Candidatus Hydrogenedentota bacterium]